MKKANEIRLVDYFKLVWIDDKRNLEREYVETEAAKRGYIVDPKGCNQIALNYIKSVSFNPNSTFYKSFEDVISKNRVELFLDQLMHYASTYGTDYQGEVYCPNGDPIQIPYDVYKVIKAVPKDVLLERVMRVCESGIALNGQTVEAFIDFLKDCKYNGYIFDIDRISNKEILTQICDVLKILPNNPDSILRLLVYKMTGSSCIIQSDQFIYKIKLAEDNGVSKILNRLNRDQLVKLSESFLRYKKIWLAMKRPKNRSVINKLRKLATKNHKPMKIGFWENFTNWPVSYIYTHVKPEIEKLNNPFKVVKLIEMLFLRENQNKHKSDAIYRVRNGKLYMDHDKIVAYNPDWNETACLLIEKLAELLRNRKQELFDNKIVMIKYPQHVHYVLPSSEKTFLGNLPFGSFYDMKDVDNIVGIYWKGRDGAQDLDLSMLDRDGSKLGWNAEYYKGENIIYSGDMTAANPEASEMLYIKKQIPSNGIICVNRYNGEQNSKYKLYLAQENITEMYSNYMVKPGSIKLSADCESTSTQQIVGNILNGKCYLFKFDMGESQVAAADVRVIKAINDMCVSHVPVPTMMDMAGYEIWSKDMEEHYKNDLHLEQGSDYEIIDLTEPNKDTLINLMK